MEEKRTVLFFKNGSLSVRTDFDKNIDPITPSHRINKIKDLPCLRGSIINLFGKCE